ncbi:mitochondrial protein [Grosmannia clavigera kw1407]|uniref:Altered inheritance of mitochondria protein 24, mitochondrial n=1 Tax=Grosmannia clavigera (strain kw1407 / UAMH 11150) TaxID=655863 RepID=F0X8T2_GROCL|nr:mitochondrial protein [Grosmannia clavigera kw1407]EFX05784.1 mitochondrial protein [Grosmannia clavigera kw1407]
MRASSVRTPPALPGCLRVQSTPRYVCRQCIITTTTSPVIGTRGIKISSAPATEFPRQTGGDAFGSTAAGSVRDESDARFEVLGSPYSLLSVTLSASQKLYTRRGTLVSVAGKLENAQSTLSILAPVRRGLLGVPFLYQRITSPTPLTLLIGTKAASTTLFTLHLDGTTDWVVAQRDALLAWTGHTLTVTPQRQTYGGTGLGLGLANWGSSFLTGRGLVALSAPGYIYPVTLAAGEELAVHPSHVVAYAVNRNAPRPFRLREGGAAAATKSATAAVANAASTTAAGVGAATARLAGRLHLQTPAIPAVPQSVSGFWKAARETATYKLAARALFTARTLLRQTIWGDRLFVHVRGPTTLLLSSRGVRISDVLTRNDVNEIADTEAGVVPAAIERVTHLADKTGTDSEKAAPSASSEAVALHVATVRQDGKVEFSDAKDLKEFVR